MAGEASWFNYICRVDVDQADAAERCLIAAGADAISYRAAGDDTLIVDELDGAHDLWPACEVVGLFPAGVSVALIERCLNDEGLAPSCTEIQTLADGDWQDSWRDQFQPLVFNDRLCVCPSWLEPPDPTLITVSLDPGLAFGTGNHATTSLCLRWLARYPSLNGASVLDFGCGSGILAIAARKLGASDVVATDIDASACEVCIENATHNEITDLRTLAPSALPERSYDIVVANILLEPLISLAERLGQFVKPGGVLVLSGILVSQADMLLAAYSRAFNMHTEWQESDWLLLAGSRR